LWSCPDSGGGEQEAEPIEWRINTVWTFDGEKLVRGRAFSSRAEALEAAELRD
jgi:hypothetical protein